MSKCSWTRRLGGLWYGMAPAAVWTKLSDYSDNTIVRWTRPYARSGRSGAARFPMGLFLSKCNTADIMAF